jgi:alkylglycerol monooxygenase
MSPSQVIVLATPVFLLLIAIELAWGWKRRRNTYRLNDAVNSISLGMLSQISAVFTRLFRIGIYTAIYSSVALFPDTTFWTSPAGWLLALVFYDFCYYWLHRAGHEVAVFWAAHVVHHQSQDYNLSTALRQTSSGALLGWIFYVPMAVAGVPPVVFAVVALVDLLYQFWVHTEHVPKLGWFDRWFCSPSNHRVHHAVNDRYLDRNYGGILIIWDRLFGSFREEDERCVYGTRSPLRSWDPLWANTEVYWGLAQDSWRAGNWVDKLRVWIKPPGWRPADVAARFPRPEFRLEGVERYHPPMRPAVAWFGALQFSVLLVGVAVFLWHADELPSAQAGVWLATLATGLWAVGAAMQGRLTVLEVLLVDAAALAVATAAADLPDAYWFFGPAAMLLAIALVAQRSRRSGETGRFEALLLSALGLSLIGNCLLMLPGGLLPGLALFLVANLFYLALFKRGLPWFPDWWALLLPMVVALALPALAFGDLEPPLQAALAAFALVSALMVAQATGRATLLRDAPSVQVAVAAGLLMLSSVLLAFHHFAAPLPFASFWVLGSYYLAQIQIARHARPASAFAPPVRSTRTT